LNVFLATADHFAPKMPALVAVLACLEEALPGLLGVPASVG